jgi:hypothetical protein
MQRRMLKRSHTAAVRGAAPTGSWFCTCTVPVACVSLALRFSLALEAAASRIATLHSTQQQQQQQQ